MTKKKKIYDNDNNDNDNNDNDDNDDNNNNNNSNEREWLLRQRQHIQLLNPNGYEIPNCLHGPCLLFERKNGNEKLEQFFACAVYRSQKRCSFRLVISDRDFRERNVPQRNFSDLNTPTTSFPYASIRKKVNFLRSKHEKIYYCPTCNDVFSLPHVHPMNGPLRNAAIRKPSQLLIPHTQNDSESQYWFSEESLSVIVNAVEKCDCNGVLCIGAPTIFEYFQTCKIRRQKFKSFLLDIDARFVPFLRASHFAVYSMLTNHFYDPKSVVKLDKFFGSVHRLIIICDPPFGVIIEALMYSLKKLRERFLSSNISELNDRWCKAIIILPIFTGKRFLDSNDFHMLDYRICYTNHSKYKRPEKSIVRLFTDLPLNAFDLSELPDYRFCNECRKFVAETSVHCNSCGTCPSGMSRSYKHCSECGRCVKGTYKHCSLCNSCHLPQRCSSIQNGSSRNSRIFLMAKVAKSRKRKSRL